MKRSFLLSVFLVVLVVLWMASGQFDQDATARVIEPETTATEAPRFKVLVKTLNAEEVPREIVVQGQLEATRILDLRAETGGQVAEILVRKGDIVSRGQLMMRLAADDRPARIAGVRAELAQQQLNLEAAQRLFERKLQSENQLKLAEAAVASAMAAVEVAELELQRTEIRAPFSGVLERVHVELGSLLDRGDPILELIDNSALKAVGHVPQQSAMEIKTGQPVRLKLLDGRDAEAQVTFVSRSANLQTRSFRVEARLEGDTSSLNAGLSAELTITVGNSRAHFLSASVLALDASGRVGVKSVDEADTVSFHPVSLVRTQADGVWVSGLPETIRVIARGQGFVVSGQQVEAVSES